MEQTQTRPLPHDDKLLEQVRPADWTNPEPRKRYNLVVIGAGSAGLVAAGGAAMLGARVALVEKRRLGGDCLNYGCVPSKSVIHASRIAATVRGARDFGIDAPRKPAVDFARAMETVREARARVSPHDSVERFRKMGVDVFFGEARFTGPDTLEAAGAPLRFSRAVIATGSSPVVPPIAGLAGVPYLTNETIFDLTENPGTLAIVGAGPIGSELGQAMQRLGVQVTFFERHQTILGKEDEAASRIVQEQMERDGVEILTGADLMSFSHEQSTGRHHVRFRHRGQEQTRTFGALLAATGRAPQIEGLGLDEAGVACDPKKGVIVDDFLRTTNKRIYASGDVCLGQKFTHSADEASRVVIANALFFSRLDRFSKRLVPRCTYTDPEVAHAGMNREEAAARDDILTLTRGFEEVDRALCEQDTRGGLTLHVERRSGRVRGATLVGTGAGETLAELTLAIQRGVKLPELNKVIHTYPTRAEIIKHLADEFATARITRWKSILRLWLRLAR